MNNLNRSRLIGADFTVGPVFPLLMRFFLPYLLANMLNSIYNTVDTIVIGQFVGSTGIIAVTLGGKMLTLFTGIGMSLAGGGQVLISQEVGAKQDKNLNATIGTLFTETIVLSVLFAVVTLLFSRQILTVLNTPEASFDAALAYLRITCIGLPLIFGYTSVSSVLRGMGDSKSPLLFIAIATVVNLIGDIIFVVAFNLSAAGTAIATVFGQGVSLVLSVIILYRRREKFGFDFRLRSFAVNWHKLGIMLKIGLPLAMRNVFITTTQLYIMSFVNLYSIAEISVYSVGDKFVHLANIFNVSARQAAGSMAGQNIGAGRSDRVRTIVKFTALICISTATVLSVIGILMPKVIFGLFDPNPDVLLLAPRFMWIACLIFLLTGFGAAYDAVITGTGKSLLSFIGGLLDGVVFRLGLSFLFAYVLDMGVTGFFLSDALARLGPLIIGAVYYHTGAWERQKPLVSN